MFATALSRSKLGPELKSARGAEFVASISVSAPEKESDPHGIGVESLMARSRWKAPLKPLPNTWIPSSAGKR